MAVVESLLDLTQLRLMAPLSLGAIFSTMLMGCLKVDGYTLSWWTAFAPLLALLSYLLLLLLFLHLLALNNHSRTSVLRGFWSNARGPGVFLYRDVLGGKGSSLAYVGCVLVLAIVQVLIVIARISDDTPSSVDDKLNWGLVFLPLWLLALLCLLLPFLEPTDPGVHMFFVVAFMLPCLVFFICLTVKLNGGESSAQQGLPIALALVPFWLVEGIVLTSSLVFLFAGVNRYRLGVERSREYIAVFLVSWGLVLPFVVFQGLLSARDAYMIEHFDTPREDIKPSAVVTISPLLALLGVWWVVTTFVSCSLKTAYQEARERVQHDVGLRVLYHI
eukprot:CAMPEP_0173336976 /NCGR_PEP_ID=MMETSP1144-20121109/6871_1 /TAXON_ID=483371 /ORGANISM="non described non described, Strain CCMP2298" /LENGTH=331 /DNA_ID=CAMNT_0014282359 /DNA_START=123 /DNA_END=1118 /DNA_ORIENTATION=-